MFLAHSYSIRHGHPQEDGHQEIFRREDGHREEVRRRGDCVSLKTLALSGADLIAAGIRPGPALGQLLNTMLDDVLAQPEHNTREYLSGRYLTERRPHV